jgi:hypothetical protein
MSCSRLLDQLAAMAVPSMRRFEQGYADCYKHFQVRGARSADTQASNNNQEYLQTTAPLREPSVHAPYAWLYSTKPLCRSP